MGSIYNYAKQSNLIKDMPGGSINWDQALIDSGKAVSQITLAPLTQDEANAIISKLDMMFRSTQHQDIANMVAEELLSILTAIQVVKWQTQSSFGGILAQGTQLDIWPLRPKDVGGALLSPATAATRGLYGGAGGAVFSWAQAGLVGGTIANIVPAQAMWQYAGMIYLGGIEKVYTPKIEGIQFTLAGIAAPPQPVSRSIKRTFGDDSEISFFRLEKPVIIPPLKLQRVDVMPGDSGTTNFELIGIVIAQSQNKVL